MKGNLSEFKQNVLEYLSAEDKSVAVINGDWGIGKTYIWENEILPNYKEQESKKSENYSYISLFGINDTREIKNNLVTKFSNHTNKLPRKKFFGFDLKVIADIGLSIAYDALIKEKVICIDDLERKGSNLKINDIFGLIEELRTQKNCKFIIIHNSEELDKEDRLQFEKFVEKISDVEFLYDPDYFNLANIIFEKENYEIEEISQFLKDICIKNLRVLKRAKDLYENIWQRVAEPYPEGLKGHLLKLCIFLTGEFFKANKLESGGLHVKRLKGELDLSDIENEETFKNDYDFLERFGDLKLISTLLVKAIDSYFAIGYFSGDLIRRGIDETIKNYSVDGVKRKLHSIYENHYYNFHKNKEEFEKDLMHLLKEHISELNVRDFSQSLDVLEKLGVCTDSLITLWMDCYKTEIASWDLEEILWEWNFKPNEKWWEEIKNHIVSSQSQLSIDSVLLEVLKEKHTNQVNESFLLQISESELYEWLIESTHKDLTSMVRGVLLKYKSVGNKLQSLGEITEKVLKRIARDDKFNRVKIQSLFGIKIDSTD